MVATSPRFSPRFSPRPSPRFFPLRALWATIFLVGYAQLSNLAWAQSGTKANGGLDMPDLQTINRPVTQTEKSDYNAPREPSYEMQGRDGTVVREYRNRGHVTDIEVQSGLGNSYKMSKPEDPSPKIRDSDVGRVPTVPLFKF